MEALLDLLSILIAFATVMLLLSLFVTSLVQSAQYLLRLRIRNLRHGVADLLDTVLTDGPDATGGGMEMAKRVLTDPRLAQGRTGASRLRETSWITREELLELLRRRGLTPAKRREVSRWFDRLEANLSKDFLTKMRWLTLACSLVVAVVFQVDAFETLRDLSVNPDLRAELSALSKEVLAERATEIAALRDERGVTEEALIRLERATEDSAIDAAIEEVGGSDLERGDQVAELREALEAHHVDSQAVGVQLAEYRRLLDAIATERLEEADALRGEVTGQLARFDLTPFGRSPGFYWRKGRGLGGLQAKHLLGVLVTAVFLSFGAPFWFNQLKNLVALRDQLEKGLRKAALEGAKTSKGGKTPAVPDAGTG